MFDSVRMTFKVVFFPCLRTGIAAPLRDTVFVPVVFLLVFVFLYCLNDLDPVADHGKTNISRRLDMLKLTGVASACRISAKKPRPAAFVLFVFCLF